ncbi:MAG: M15 family metallopeptidase [Solibacillus sp.]
MEKLSTKRNNRTIIFGAIISFVLLLAIIGSIFYKTDKVNDKVEPVAQQETLIDNKQEQAQLVTQAEQQAPQVEQKNIEQPTATNVEEKPVEKVSPATASEKEDSTSGYIEGQKPPTEPTYIKGILIANKKYPLPATYNEGEDLTAKAAFEKMAAAAKLENIELVAFSGFRSYEYQTTLYNNYVARDGQEKADRYSARPGHSEHQTGLAFDIGEKGREDLWLTSAFGETEAGQWLVKNAHKHGFILRYPKGQEQITGFMYESWHFRYLGIDIATKVYESGLTLEEYLGIN